jgi:sec-independent protein translocase protein TatA
MLPKIGLPELMIILAIVFFLFGAKRLPEIGKGIGEGIKNFKGAMKQSDKDLQENKKKEAS